MWAHHIWPKVSEKSVCLFFACHHISLSLSFSQMIRPSSSAPHTPSLLFPHGQRDWSAVSNISRTHLDLESLVPRTSTRLRTSLATWPHPSTSQLQNLALATLSGQTVRRQPKNTTADDQHVKDKCESLGSEKQLILHRNPSTIAKDFSPHVAILRRPFFAE